MKLNLLLSLSGLHLIYPQLHVFISSTKLLFITKINVILFLSRLASTHCYSNGTYHKRTPQPPHNSVTKHSVRNCSSLVLCSSKTLFVFKSTILSRITREISLFQWNWKTRDLISTQKKLSPLRPKLQFPGQ